MKRINVAAAVIVEGSKIFAAARGYGEYKGWWEFPGGKIEPGETPEEALKREIMEELDTEISVEELIGRVEYDYPEFHLSMACFLCERLSGDLRLLEAAEAGWLGAETLDSVPWLPADRVMLDKIRTLLTQPG